MQYVLVLAVDKREDSAVYASAKLRLELKIKSGNAS
ncbi:hypothetical protein S2091_2046 [Solimicrobium silvestre]|uniref:Uncharacterized protein n=1 Tax=Solimicrobium silvestre TaxID=2099400 RepID=A0A2S9H032_9BURK|nr:hypothetical protein S2091_2046 [Solimicrobium silvestre]